MRQLCLFVVASLCVSSAFAQNNAKNPTWWDKYQYILNNGADADSGTTTSVTSGTNVDVSNECGPQSETYIAISTNGRALAGGSNEIFRDPMRGYASSDGGRTWSGVDLPLPPAIGTNGIRFGSDPTLAFDSRGNLYYGYIVVFFGSGNGINGTEMAVAKSTDGGKSYPSVTYFSFSGGSDHFNDKPMITTDTNIGSAFRDSVYIAWDAASGGSNGGGIRVAASRDGGASFTVTRADDPQGPGHSIGAVPFVGTNGELYVAWNDYAANTIEFNRSFDGGRTWGAQSTLANKTIPFDAAIPAEFNRRALIYPACDVDRSKGAHRGRLVCSWTDTLDGQTTDIVTSYSDNQGATWSAPQPATDRLPYLVDRFNQWLSIDPTNGVVNVAYYDTRNDTTGTRYNTDFYVSRSSDGGASYASPNIRATDAMSNEHDCDGVFPCRSINYGNQQGDYAGVVAWGGITHPFWVDSRRNTDTSTGCARGLMEEVFTANVK